MAITGDIQGKIMTEVQPMKMAAAEALYETEQPARRSRSSPSARPTAQSEKFAIRDPVPAVVPGHRLDFDGKVEGINELREQYKAEYGADPARSTTRAGDYTPVIPVTYWSFRFMIGLGLFVAAGAALILWLTRRGRTPTAAVVRRPRPSRLPIAAVLANSFGWIFTEMGRQPWVVFGLMTTEQRGLPRRQHLRGVRRR